MRHYDGDLYEAVVVQDSALDAYQPVFSSFPELQEYPVKDLFSKHPTKMGLWRFRGRSDDIVVCSTGEKFNPATMEDAVNSHPMVRAALVCGDARFQSGLLVEPAVYPENEIVREALIASLWPTVDRANKESPVYAKVLRHMILLGTADRPLPRPDKGTVQKRLTEQMCEPDLEKLYAAAEELKNSRTTDDAGSPDFAVALQQAISHLDGFGLVTLDENLFDRGMDSLGVLNFVRSIRSLSRQLTLKLEVIVKDAYQCKNLRELALSLTAPAIDARPATEVLQELYEHYTSDLPINAREATARPTTGKIVLLTGSTGSLGSYLLDALLKDKTVAQVVCLNRSPNAEYRQVKSMQDKALCSDFTTKPVRFLRADLSQSRFLRADLSQSHLGLAIETYRQLLGKVIHIVHNAWQVDFNVSLEHLARTHVHGVRQFIDFSARSKHAAFIFFISSISTVKRWTPADGD